MNEHSIKLNNYNKLIKLLLSIFIWLMFVLVAFSQKKATFSIQKKNLLLIDLLINLENKFEIKFSYQDDLVKNKTISLNKTNVNFKELIFEIENKLPIKFQKINDNNYIIIKSKNVNKKQINFNTIFQLDHVIVTNYLTSGIYKKKDASFLLNLANLSILPGLIENDVIESIQLLPGVLSPNETATGLNVRGGTNDQNRIIWDGINSYHSGHIFGMVSAFNPEMINKVTFYNKGTKPKFGENISSVTNIKTSNKISKDIDIAFNLNGINASAKIELPIINNKLSVQMATRRSYTEFVQTPTFDKLAKKVFQNTKISEQTNITNDFFFSDYAVKLNYKPNTNNQFYISLFNIENNLDFLTKTIDNTNFANDKLVVKNKGYSIKWNKKWNKNSSQKTLASFSNYNFKYNFITNDNINQNTDFSKKNEIFDTSLQTEFLFRTNNQNLWSFGYQYNFKDVAYSFIESSNISIILDNDKSINTTHAFHSNFSYTNKNLIDFEAGFRVNYYANFNTLKFEPRVIIHKEILKNVSLQITGEIKNQIINQIDETITSDLSLENKVWRLANDNEYPIINSHQISTGFIYNNNNWSFDVDFYKKNITNLTSLSLGFLNPNGNLIHIGKQKINGVDLYIKKDFNAINTWFSYSFTDVKSKFEGINNNKYFTANNAIKHALKLSVAYKLKQFEMALGFNLRSGKPYTKAIIDNNQIISFNEINTAQLQAYHRLDFSSTYHFTLSNKNKIKSKIGLSIKNLYNQNNQLSKEYTGNNSINDPIEVVDRFALGFTPNFLFKIYW